MKRKQKYVAIGILGILLLIAMVTRIYLLQKDGKISQNKEKTEGVTEELENNEKLESQKEVALVNHQKVDKNGIKVIPDSVKKVTSQLPPTWSKNDIYTKGDQVVYNKRIYTAKWWTQGEIPGKDEWGPWEYTGKTAVLSEENSEKQTASKKENNKADNTKKTDNTKSEDFKVVVYYPSWKSQDLDKIQYDIVTHIIYAFAIPKEDGTLRDLENPDLAKKLIKTSHKEGKKVLLAIGGWSYQDVPLESTFKKATSTAKKRKKLIQSILDMCQEYGFDGIDMDWEHPRVDDSSKTQYESLMVSLGKQLHNKGKLLTSAVLSGATPDGGVYYDAAAHTDKVIKAVDWFHVMAYDGGDGERHSSYEFAVNCGKYWTKTRKMPASKVVLGVPFYGRPSWASYEDILAANPKAYATDISKINGMEAHYNGVATIKKKTRYAKKNLGGIMVWEITQDTSKKSRSLLTAIGKELGIK